MNSLTKRLEQDNLELHCAKEVQGLHQVFVTWFRGLRPASELLDDLHGRLQPGFSHVAPNGQFLKGRSVLMGHLQDKYACYRDRVFQIDIYNVHLLWTDGDKCLCTYEEWQSWEPQPKSNDGSNNPEEDTTEEDGPQQFGRLSTCLLEKVAGRLTWVHVHETWLEAESPNQNASSAVTQFSRENVDDETVITGPVEAHKMLTAAQQQARGTTTSAQGAPLPSGPPGAAPYGRRGSDDSSGSEDEDDDEDEDETEHSEPAGAIHVVSMSTPASSSVLQGARTPLSPPPPAPPAAAPALVDTSASTNSGPRNASSIFASLAAAANSVQDQDQQQTAPPKPMPSARIAPPPPANAPLPPKQASPSTSSGPRNASSIFAALAAAANSVEDQDQQQTAPQKPMPQATVSARSVPPMPASAPPPPKQTSPSTNSGPRNGSSILAALAAAANSVQEQDQQQTAPPKQMPQTTVSARSVPPSPTASAPPPPNQGTRATNSGPRNASSILANLTAAANSVQEQDNPHPAPPKPMPQATMATRRAPPPPATAPPPPNQAPRDASNIFASLATFAKSVSMTDQQMSNHTATSSSKQADSTSTAPLQPARLLQSNKSNTNSNIVKKEQEDSSESDAEESTETSEGPEESSTEPSMEDLVTVPPPGSAAAAIQNLMTKSQQVPRPEAQGKQQQQQQQQQQHQQRQLPNGASLAASGKATPSESKQGLTSAEQAFLEASQGILEFEEEVEPKPPVVSAQKRDVEEVAAQATLLNGSASPIPNDVSAKRHVSPVLQKYAKPLTWENTLVGLNIAGFDIGTGQGPMADRKWYETFGPSLEKMAQSFSIPKPRRKIGLPEMVFPTAHVVLEGHGIWLSWDALDALEAWAKCHHMIAIHSRIAWQGVNVLRVQDAKLWESKRKHITDDEKSASIFHYDWTFCTPFCGKVEGGKWQELDESGMRMELLTDQSVPILFFDEVVLFEDDLHDNGQVQFTIKLRVMPTCAYILARLWLRVDHIMLRLRETRVLVDFFGIKPCVYRDVTWRECAWENLGAHGLSNEVRAWHFSGRETPAWQAQMLKLPEVDPPKETIMKHAVLEYSNSNINSDSNNSVRDSVRSLGNGSSRGTAAKAGDDTNNITNNNDTKDHHDGNNNDDDGDEDDNDSNDDESSDEDEDSDDSSDFDD